MTTRPWHRWVLDPLVETCRARAMLAFVDAAEFVAAGDGVFADRALIAFWFWVRAGFALSPRPCREFTVGPVPVATVPPGRSDQPANKKGK